MERFYVERYWFGWTWYIGFKWKSPQFGFMIGREIDVSLGPLYFGLWFW